MSKPTCHGFDPIKNEKNHKKFTLGHLDQIIDFFLLGVVSTTQFAWSRSRCHVYDSIALHIVTLLYISPEPRTLNPESRTRTQNPELRTQNSELCCLFQWMVVGLLGQVVVSLVVLEDRQEHAQIQHQQMEDLTVLDLQVNRVTHKHVLVNQVNW